MWPKSNNRVAPTKIEPIKTPKVKTVGIPTALKEPITTQEPVMHMMPLHMTTNPLAERGRMFNNLKTFLNRNKIMGKI